MSEWSLVASSRPEERFMACKEMEVCKEIEGGTGAYIGRQKRKFDCKDQDEDDGRNFER
jgi:hypothetical protein